jgi:hypothetical protein
MPRIEDIEKAHRARYDALGDAIGRLRVLVNEALAAEEARADDEGEEGEGEP